MHKAGTPKLQEPQTDDGNIQMLAEMLVGLLALNGKRRTDGQTDRDLRDPHGFKSL
jgi:hypothetical protein